MTLHRILSAEQVQVGDTVVHQDCRYQVTYIESEKLGKELYLRSNEGDKALFVGDADSLVLEI
jgi:hypothetical protein